MRQPEQHQITVSADVWNLISKVPAQELERVLRKAFPGYFAEGADLSKQISSKALDQIQQLNVSKPDFDVNEHLRSLRDESHI